MGPVLPLIWLISLGAVSLIPALVYAASAPDERPYLTKCGELKVPKIKNDEFVKIATTRPIQPTLLVRGPAVPHVQGVPRAPRG